MDAAGPRQPVHRCLGGRHGCGGGRQRLDAGLPTLAERLAAAGYATGAVSANAWLGPGSGFERGFARFVKAWQLVDRGGDLAGVRRAGRASGRTDLAEAVRRARAGGLTATGVNGLHHLLWRRHGRLGGGRVARRTVDVARELAAGGRPVFLFVNFLDAHLPYRAPRRYRRAVLGRRARPARRVNQDPWAFVSGALAMTGDELELLRGLYAAELAHVDDRTRQLLDGVDEVLGLDDTLVVVVSDHGEHLGEHGLMDHQYSLSETLLRVPLAVRWPGGEHAGAHAGLRQLVDVAPTVLDAAGLPVPEEPGWAGHSAARRAPGPWPSTLSPSRAWRRTPAGATGPLPALRPRPAGPAPGRRPQGRDRIRRLAGPVRPGQRPR